MDPWHCECDAQCRTRPSHRPSDPDTPSSRGSARGWVHRTGDAGNLVSGHKAGARGGRIRGYRQGLPTAGDAGGCAVRASRLVGRGGPRLVARQRSPQRLHFTRAPRARRAAGRHAVPTRSGKSSPGETSLCPEVSRRDHHSRRSRRQTRMASALAGPLRGGAGPMDWITTQRARLVRRRD